MNRLFKLTAAALIAVGALSPLSTLAEQKAKNASLPYELSYEGNGAYGSNLADLTADAMKWYAGQQKPYKKPNYTFIGNEVIQGSLPAGELSDEALDAAFADTKLVEFTIKGRYLVEGLEDCVRNFSDDNGSFVTPAGMGFILNPSNPGLEKDERYHEVNAVLTKIVLKDNKRFDQTLDFKVVMDEETFLSNPKFTDNAKMIVSSEEAVTAKEMVRYYIEKGLGGTLTETYINPRGDGRTRIASSADLVYDAEANEYTYKLKDAYEQENGNCWIAVPEEQLKKKLQGIVGNSLYHGTFMADFPDGTSLKCDASRYAVLVPVSIDQKTGKFSIRYDEVIGQGTNNIVLIITMITMIIVFVSIAMAGRVKK